MRTTEWTTRFKKDYRREKKSPHGATLDELLFPIVELLATDAALEARLHDHGLTSDWSDPTLSWGCNNVQLGTNPKSPDVMSGDFR